MFAEKELRTAKSVVNNDDTYQLMDIDNILIYQFEKQYYEK